MGKSEPQTTQLAKIRKLRKAVKEIDKLAESGMCEFTANAKHAYLKDIRRIAWELDLQGGLTGVHDV